MRLISARSNPLINQALNVLFRGPTLSQCCAWGSFALRLSCCSSRLPLLKVLLLGCTLRRADASRRLYTERNFVSGLCELDPLRRSWMWSAITEIPESYASGRSPARLFPSLSAPALRLLHSTQSLSFLARWSSSTAIHRASRAFRSTPLRAPAYSALAATRLAYETLAAPPTLGTQHNYAVISFVDIFVRFVNVTVTESRYGPYSGEPSEPGNNTPRRAERLSTSGQVKHGA